MVWYFFVAASCTSKIASVIHFGAFFMLSDKMWYVKLIVILISKLHQVFSVGNA